MKPNSTHEAYKAEVRRTHALLKPISVEAAAIFYPTLFEVDPSAKPLFKNVDMDKQGAKLMKILGVAVLMLDKFEEFKPMLVKLGKKHVTYGVKEEMYPSVVSALLITLDKGLGKECRPETKAAWEWVMNSIAAVCIAAAREEVGGGEAAPTPAPAAGTAAAVKPRSAAYFSSAPESRVVVAAVVAFAAAAAVGLVARAKLDNVA